MEDEFIGAAVWAVSIADHHADVLTPKQIEWLYKAGDLLRQAALYSTPTPPAGDDAKDAEIARLRSQLSDNHSAFAWIQHQAENVMTLTAKAAVKLGDDDNYWQDANRYASDIAANAELRCDAMESRHG